MHWFCWLFYIRHSEKQNIWIGLSRETAHQLGTPVSALLGWLDYLKHEKTDLEKILPEIESDIEDFSKLIEDLVRWVRNLSLSILTFQKG